MTVLHDLLSTWFALWGVAAHVLAAFVAYVLWTERGCPVPWDPERRQARQDARFARTHPARGGTDAEV